VPELERTSRERRVDGALDLLRRAAAITGGVALAVIVAVMGWQVFGRYVLNSTPTWAEQLSILLIAYITFLLAAVGVAERTHLSVDFLLDNVPRPVRTVLEIVRDLLILGFGAAIAVQAWGLTQFNWRRNIPLLDVPEGLRSLPAAIGGTLMALFALVLVWRRVRGRPLPPLRAPETPTGEDD
jgi:TRAP-type C4-dicarboxylate transport system permease small subunit